MADLHFELVTPEKLVRSDEVHMVVVPGSEGEFGVMAGHAPFMTTLKDGELITAVRFPVPKRAGYEKHLQQASQFPLVGVFLAQMGDGGVRVAVTGAGNGVFRHAGLEDALNKSFTPQAAAAVKIDASDLNSDLHASAAYRANLISVLTQRAVAKALG